MMSSDSDDGDSIKGHKEKAVGEIEIKRETLKEKEVLWTIPNFSTLSTFRYHNAPVFSFLNVRWYLRFDPMESDSEDHVALDLMMDKVGLSYNMLCTFAIKKTDGSSIGTVSFKHIFCDENPKLIADRFYTTSALWQLKSELSENLTIMCSLKQLPHPTKISELNSLSENIKGLFIDGEYCDVTLHVKDKEFKVHKIILAARSPVFASYFKHETSEKQNGVVNIPDCDPNSFPEFLQYLYSGELGNISFQSALHLYKTADKYDVSELKVFCIEYMEYNLNIEYFFDVLSLAEVHDDKNLFAAAQDFFNRNLSAIFATDEWHNLMKCNSSMANKLLVGMSTDVQVVSKRRRLE